MSKDAENSQQLRNRIRLAWRRASPGTTQAELAEQFDVTQARVSQIVSAPREERLSDLEAMPSDPDKWPEDFWWPRDGIGTVRFEDGKDERPWQRDVGKIPREELVEMAVEFDRCAPPIRECRENGRAKQDACNTLKRIAHEHAVPPGDFVRLLTGRHSRWSDQPELYEQIQRQTRPGARLDRAAAAL